MNENLKKINEIQKLLFELMRLATFNNFDGNKVVNDLIENAHLWESAIMMLDNTSYLIPLRDIEKNYYAVDTLYILTNGTNDKYLKKICSKWEYDVFEIIRGDEASNEPATGPVNWQLAGYNFINWMVTGGESGSGAVAMHPDYVRETKNWCAANAIPFFFKQWGQWVPVDQLPATVSRNLKKSTWQMSLYPKIEFYYAGKASAGRLLDGKTYDEMPDTSII